MILRGVTVLALSLLLSSKGYNQEVDSLLNKLASLSSDTAKISHSEMIFDRISQTNPDTAVVIAEQLYSDIIDTDAPAYYKALAALNVGRVHLRKGGYTKALEYFQRAYDIEIDESYVYMKGEILRGLGNIYFIQYQPVESMKFYKESLFYFRKINDEPQIANTYGGIANIYYEDQNYDSSLAYNLKALEIRKRLGSEMAIARSYLNTGMLYDAMDSLDLAIEYSLFVLDVAERNNALLMSTYPLKILSSVYRKKGDYASAIKYATKSLEIANSMDIIYEQKDAHSNLAMSNYEMGNYKKAYDHLYDHKTLNDSLLNEDANIRLADMRARYEKEKIEKENEILASKSALQKTRFAAILSSLALTLVFVSFFFYRNISKKKKEIELAEKDKLISESKRKLAEEQLSNSELKAQNLENELTNYAFHIIEKNNFLEEVKNEMSEIRSQVKNDDAIRHINQLGSKIYQNLMINKDREEFENQVEQVCEGFFKKLEAKHPDLTNQERRLAALLRLNLSSKDISGILNISPKSVDQTRYRLRKKMNLEKSKNLSLILNQI